MTNKFVVIVAGVVSTSYFDIIEEGGTMPAPLLGVDGVEYAAWTVLSIPLSWEEAQKYLQEQVEICRNS
jgi:hypothetical protein